MPKQQSKAAIFQGAVLPYSYVTKKTSKKLNKQKAYAKPNSLDEQQENKCSEQKSSSALTFQ